MTSKAYLVCAMALLGTLGVVGAGWAASTLDQQSQLTGHFLDSHLSAGGVPYNGEYETAQTFTAGMSGRLTKFDFLGIIKRPGAEIPNLLVSVIRTDFNGAPLAQLSDCIAQAVVVPDSIPETGPHWTTVSVDLTRSDIRMAKGDMLAVAIKAYWATPPTTTSRGYYQLSGHVLDSTGRVCYGDGMYYSRKIGVDAWTVQPKWDIDFRTYMDTSVPVPEPCSMLALAFGAVGMALRRRRG